MSIFDSIDAENGDRTPPRCGSNDISRSSESHFAVASREFASQATPFARRLVGASYIASYLLIASFTFPSTAIRAAGTVTLDGSQWHIDRRTAVLPKSTILQAELAEGADQPPRLNRSTPLATAQTEPTAESKFLRQMRAASDADDAADYKTAIQHYSSALSFGAPNKRTEATALTLRGVARGRLGRMQEALKDLNRAVAFSPRFPLAYYGRAWILLKNERFAEALKDYDVLVRILPDDADIQLGRGNALKGLGRLSDARAAYDRALEIDPNFRKRRRLL